MVLAVPVRMMEGRAEAIGVLVLEMEEQAVLVVEQEETVEKLVTAELVLEKKVAAAVVVAVPAREMEGRAEAVGVLVQVTLIPRLEEPAAVVLEQEELVEVVLLLAVARVQVALEEREEAVAELVEVVVVLV